jgi:hypothetical protein
LLGKRIDSLQTHELSVEDAAVTQLLATFGDALLQAHRSLLKDLRALHRAVQATPAERPAELAAVLEGARANVHRHFHFEERNGYTASVLEVQPHLERAVQRLHEEHGRLLRWLDGLIAEVRSASALSDELREQVRGWLRGIQRHERSENILVQDAFNLDIGSEE